MVSNIFLVGAGFYIVSSFRIGFLQRKWYAALPFAFLMGIIQLLILWQGGYGYPDAENVLFTALAIPAAGILGHCAAAFILNIRALVRIPILYEQDPIPTNWNIDAVFVVGFLLDSGAAWTLYYWMVANAWGYEGWAIFTAWGVFMVSFGAQYWIVRSAVTEEERQCSKYKSFDNQTEVFNVFLVYTVFVNILVLSLFFGLIQFWFHHIWALTIGLFVGGVVLLCWTFFNIMRKHNAMNQKHFPTSGVTVGGNTSFRMFF